MMDDRYGYGIVHTSPVPGPLQVVWMLGLLALIVVGVVLALRYIGGKSSAQSSNQSPLEVLNMRYAKGEIERAEYDTIRQALVDQPAAEPIEKPAEVDKK